MGRPAYQINQRDYAGARTYIQNAMKRGSISVVSGHMWFRHADTPEKLQAWCDKYLSTEAFNQLKQAVRAARKRSKDYKTTARKVRVDLDHLAHLRLSSLAEELGGKTLSETVLIMEEAYYKARDNRLI